MLRRQGLPSGRSGTVRPRGAGRGASATPPWSPVWGARKAPRVSGRGVPARLVRSPRWASCQSPKLLDGRPGRAAAPGKRRLRTPGLRSRTRGFDAEDVEAWRRCLVPELPGAARAAPMGLPWSGGSVGACPVPAVRSSLRKPPGLSLCAARGSGSQDSCWHTTASLRPTAALRGLTGVARPWQASERGWHSPLCDTSGEDGGPGASDQVVGVGLRRPFRREMARGAG